MSSVDNRVVKMEFDNDRFKKNAADTKDSIRQVDQAIATAGKGRGLLNISSAMQTVGVTASKMAVVTTTALATVTNQAVNAGLQLAKSLTLDPIRSGFQEYESLLSKQNVIMNATGKSADSVKAVLNDLNHYSDKTIFSFSDMTEGLTSFVNAGVPLEDASKAMKGIANASALAGASTQEAQSSFRAFGQALGQGYLGLQDYRQAAITGKIGTVGFKQSLIDAAVAQGTLTKRGNEYVTKSGKTLTATKNFDLSLQEQWANTEVLNEALRNYGDENTKLGKKAFKAAQDVRTFSAFMDTLKESLGSGFSQVFTALIGGLEESTRKWTNLSNTVGAATNRFFNFATTAIMTFKELGGGAKVMEGLRNVAAPFVALFKAVGDAFQEAFPTTGKSAGSTLFDMASGFARITAPLQTVAKWITKLTPYIANFFKAVKMGANGLSNVAGLISDLASALGDLVAIDVPSGSGIIDKILGGLGNIGNAAVGFLQDLIGNIADAAGSVSFDSVGTVLGTGLLAAIGLGLRKLLSGGLNFNFDVGGGILSNISDSFETLTGSLQALQTNIQSKTLMNIAIAVGVLSASMVALSLIDSGKLKKSLLAMTAGFAQLLAAMAILVKISGSAGFVQVPLIAGAMVLLAGSLAILVGAIALMGQLEWTTIGKGLTGIGGALVVIAAGMKLMPKSLPITAAGLLLVSVSLNAIAGAIAIMGNLEWETIGKGLTTTAGALVVIAGAMKLMPLTLPVTAAGLILVGIALNGIAAALKIMATMSWKEIGRGLATLGGAMVILAAGLNAMNGTLLGSAAMLVAAVAVNTLVPALILMSTLSWEDIAKAMVGLAGGLVILGLAMTGMIAALPGAAALLVVSPALLALSTALLALSTISWEGLGIALVALAAGLTVIGLAGLLLAPVIPALIGLGAALLLMGAGLALAGLGITTFAAGLTALVALGGGAIAYLSDYIKAFIDLLPELGAGFAELIVQFAKTITANAPVFVNAFVTMIESLLTAAQKLLPKIGTFFSKMITTALGVLRKAVPQMANAGADIIIGLINGISSRVGEMAHAASQLIQRFIAAIATESVAIATAAANAVITFINGMAEAIRNKGPELGAAMGNLGVAMVQGLIGGIGSMVGSAVGKIESLAGDMIGAAKKKLSIFSPSRVFKSIGKFLVEGLTLGIQNNAANAINSVASMVSGQIAVANEYISKFIQKLDQKAILAKGTADGLARAAEKAQNAANKTKNKKDDKAADRLTARAKRADKAADAAEARAQRAKDKQDRKAEYNAASTIDKARMRSEDAQNQLDAAKDAETRAVSKLAEADALDRQSRASGVKAAQRKKMRAEADRLRREAKADAQAANAQLAASRGSAADALALQKQAGKEAADAYQAIFDAEAKADADEKAFAKLSDADKAKERQRQAEELQAKAKADLEAAKKLAYTDLDAANELAQQALEESEQARQYLDDAKEYADAAAQGSGAPGANDGGTVVKLDPVEAASIAMNEYSDLFDAASAAAAANGGPVFNQYNTSPEALDPTTVYRQTNNLLNYAADQIDDAA